MALNNEINPCLLIDSNKLKEHREQKPLSTSMLYFFSMFHFLYILSINHKHIFI